MMSEIKSDLLGIDSMLERLDMNNQTIQACTTCKDEMFNKYVTELKELKKKVDDTNRMFVQVVDNFPDMLWAKDMQGKYIMANKAFMKDFCYGMEWFELQGKTDVEIAKQFKDKVGNDNHTFGEKCANSDEIIKQTEEAKRFLELGNIDGKLMKLEVHKSPVYDSDGVLYAVYGVGRDITEIHNEIMEAIETCCDEKTRALLIKIANKYEFNEG